MKKLVIALVMLVAAMNSQAQTIGDHFNTVEAAKPAGNLDATKPYTYTVEEKSVSSIMMYFFDDNLICDKMVIAPQTGTARQRWIASFNDSWITINSTQWKFYKSDGMILKTTLEYVSENVGTVFFIVEEKIEN